MSERVVAVGLCGDIGAGKDTVGRLLARDHGFTVVSFAAPLKEICLQIYGPLGLERRHLFGTQAEKNEPIPTIVGPHGLPRCGREIAEIIGTEGARGVCPLTWTALGAIEGRRIIEEGGRVVFTDVRFDTEFTAIRRSLGGVIWEVVKTGVDAPPMRDHASDQEWRRIPKDGLVVAPAGDMKRLALEVNGLLHVGGVRHARLLKR